MELCVYISVCTYNKFRKYPSHTHAHHLTFSLSLSCSFLFSILSYYLALSLFLSVSVAGFPSKHYYVNHDTSHCNSRRKWQISSIFFCPFESEKFLVIKDSMINHNTVETCWRSKDSLPMTGLSEVLEQISWHIFKCKVFSSFGNQKCQTWHDIHVWWTCWVAISRCILSGMFNHIVHPNRWKIFHIPPLFGLRIKIRLSTHLSHITFHTRLWMSDARLHHYSLNH